MEHETVQRPVLRASSLHGAMFPVQSHIPTWRERARQQGRQEGQKEGQRDVEGLCVVCRDGPSALVGLWAEDAALCVGDVRCGPRPVSPIFKQHLKPIQDIRFYLL